ncbi:nitroreductase family protein [Schlesneria paludicola]|uniref:hypothetical protein n=1 Tax=Schlesneria paludicola TaxID=360056 RepID=UPI00049265B7|nr:hypothetical protein [Schlesneria paludicola]
MPLLNPPVSPFYDAVMQTTGATIGSALAAAVLSLLLICSPHGESHEHLREVVAAQAKAETASGAALIAETERAPLFAESLRRMGFSTCRMIGHAAYLFPLDPAILGSCLQGDRCTVHIIRFNQHEVLRV